MSKKLVEEGCFEYRRLKALYPEQSVFYSWYFPGGYLDTDYTKYYDKDGNELKEAYKNHGNYA